MASLIGASVVMGVFLVGVLVYLNAHKMRKYTPMAKDGEPLYRRLSGSLTVWILGFIAIVGGLAGGAVAYVSVSPEQQGLVAMALGGLLALILAGWVLFGTYRSGRNRGLPSATAAMVSAWAFGALFTLAVAVKLLL
ncbi:hypothetical protein [Haloarchaeobius sp. DFWS5]|uniref:hypothetical protein n=1 Tax=Haloarchaeobius sp. DFWS5 TaxID=3446114 RepID=UPI003EBDAA77